MYPFFETAVIFEISIFTVFSVGQQVCQVLVSNLNKIEMPSHAPFYLFCGHFKNGAHIGKIEPAFEALD